jgi:hypothetical protein
VKINFKAVAWGLAFYAALYTLHLLLLPVLIGTEAGGKESSVLLYAIHQLLGLLTCIAAGFVAARKAGELGFLHGLVVGIVGTLLSLCAAMIWAAATDQVIPSIGTLPFWMLINGFLCAFAGLVAADLREEPESAARARVPKPSPKAFKA